MTSPGSPISRRQFSTTMLQMGAGLAASALAAAASKDRSDRRTVGLAFGTYGLKDLPTADALRLIADTGYDAVELCVIAGWPTDPAKLSAPSRSTLRKQIDDTGLALPAMLESIPLTGTEKARTNNLERLKRAVELGNELRPGNPPFIDTILGRKKADWETAKREMAEELSRWVPILEDGRTTLVFKPHAGDAVQSVERALWILNEVGSPRIRVVFDYSHFYIEGYPLEETLRQLLPYSPLIVAKDGIGTSEKHTFLLPGDGKIDYVEYFRLLRTLGYSGFVSIEVSAMIHRKPDYAPIPTTRLCYERLAPLMEQAGLVRPPRIKRAL